MKFKDRKTMIIISSLILLAMLVCPPLCMSYISDNRKQEVLYATDTTSPTIVYVDYQEDFNFRASVIDDFGIDAVFLFYRINETSWYYTGMHYVVENNSYYCHRILPSKSNVEYYIWTNDTSGNIQTSLMHKLSTMEDDLSSPEIYIFPPQFCFDATSLRIEAFIIDVNPIHKAIINCRVDYAGWNALEMDKNGSFFSKSFVLGASPEEFFEYFIWANDTEGNYELTEIYNVTLPPYPSQIESAPLIENVSYYPQPPKTYEDLIISVNVSSTLEMQRVLLVLYTSINGWDSFQMELINGSYSILIGNFTEPFTLFNFFIFAEDINFNSSKTEMFSFNIESPTSFLGADSDSDDLSDFDEIYFYLTNSQMNDSDSDGLLDGEEVLVYFTDPLNSDSDSDGLSDNDELNIYFTNPLNSDSDSDGLFDSDEVLVYNTNPNLIDSDNDGLSDYDEIFSFFTSPNNNDSDNDGLNDNEEIYLYKTNPNDADSDDDGKDDFWEVNHGFNPNRYTLIFVENIILRVLTYASPFIIILTLVIAIRVIIRRRRIKVLQGFYQRHEGYLLSLKEIILTLNFETKIKMNDITESLLYIGLKGVKNIDLHNESNKLSKIIQKSWSKKYLNQTNISELLSEIFEGFLAAIDNLDYSSIQNTMDEIVINLDEITYLDSAYIILDEQKYVLDQFKKMLEVMKYLFDFHSIYIKTIENQFINSFSVVSDRINIWENQAQDLRNKGKAIEQKYKDIERVKTLNELLKTYSRVPVKQMMSSLDFHTRENLEHWLLDNFSTVPYSIEGDEIILKTESDKEEMVKIIDSLLDEFEKWADEGGAKKQ